MYPKETGERTTDLYIESLHVSLSDQVVRTEKIDANQTKSAADVVILRKQSLRLASRLRQLDLRLGKLAAKV